MNTKAVFIAPQKYVQGRGVLRELGNYAALFGRKAVVLWDATVKGAVGEVVLASMKEPAVEVVDVPFGGESTREEAARVAGIIRDHGAQVCIGIGGGKTLDCAKAAAWEAGVRMISTPTVASNDAPTSAISMWFDAAGNCTGYTCWPFNPNIVLVDSEVVSRAPVRSLVAGMGDALATWLEARASFKSRARTLAGGVPTMTALAIAELCFDTLQQFGIEAKRAVEVKTLTPAVEKVIEANVLMSGLGFESGGLATAHMIANALPVYPECHHLMHGEKVGFGILCQLCLDEDTDIEEMRRIIDFEIGIGLPVTLADLNLHNATREKLRILGDACAAEGSLCANHVFPVTSESVIDAILAADAVGRARKELSNANGREQQCR